MISLKTYITFIRQFMSRSLVLKITLTLGIISFSSLFVSFTPLFLQQIIDGLVAKKAFVLLMGPLLLYIGSHFIGRIQSDSRWIFYGTAEQELKGRLCERFFHHLFHMPYLFFLKHNGAHMTQVMTTGVDANRHLMANIFFVLLPTAVELLTSSIVLLAFGNIWVVLAIGMYTTFYLLTSARTIDELTTVNQNAYTHTQRAAAQLGDAMANAQTIRYFKSLPFIENAYKKMLSQSTRLWRQFYRRKIGWSLMQAGVFIFTIGSCLFYALWQVSMGYMLLGHFVLINMYLFQVCRPLEGVVLSLRDVRLSLSQMEPLLKIMKKKRIQERPYPLPSKDQALNCQGLSFSYPDGRKALHNITFSLPQGQTLAIVGPTGSGKSTLVKLLMGLFEPTSGLLQILPSPAIIPQEIALFHETLAFNLKIAKPDATEEEMAQVIEQAELSSLLRNLPEGYETNLGTSGLKLSGGERQRLAIARALLMNPKLIVCDEATSSLDLVTEDKVLKTLKAASHHKTLIIISHRTACLELADHILVLKEGHICEQGSHTQLINAEGWYAHMRQTEKKEAANQEKKDKRHAS